MRSQFMHWQGVLWFGLETRTHFAAELTIANFKERAIDAQFRNATAKNT